MRTPVLVRFTLALALLCGTASVSQAQSTDALKAEKLQKLKKAKALNLQKFIGYGYHGGTMAPLGVALYTLNPEKIGFYASYRGLLESDSPYKGLVLNVGITKYIAYPVAFYVAGGISDYATSRPLAGGYGLPKGWEFGADTSAGVLVNFNRLEVQAGVSLFSFGRPEFCFGLGYNMLRF